MCGEGARLCASLHSGPVLRWTGPPWSDSCFLLGGVSQYVFVSVQGMDVSFSGILSNCQTLVHNQQMVAQADGHGFKAPVHVITLAEDHLVIPHHLALV